MNEERPGTLLQSIQRVRAFMRAQIKWFTRLPIGILFLFFLVLNPIAPEFVEEISTSLGLAKPSLVTIIGVATLFFILERIIVIEDEVIWSCTTCGACVYNCPVDIEHIDAPTMEDVWALAKGE
jgi:Fe-S oxidoreductase